VGKVVLHLAHWCLYWQDARREQLEGLETAKHGYVDPLRLGGLRRGFGFEQERALSVRWMSRRMGLVEDQGRARALSIAPRHVMLQDHRELVVLEKNRGHLHVHHELRPQNWWALGSAVMACPAWCAAETQSFRAATLGF
jgi:hypothetical protein